jgi:hypothetical protein
MRVRIMRPGAHHTLAAASVGLVLLGASAYPATAIWQGASGPASGRGPIGGPRSRSIGDPAALALLSRIQHLYSHAPGVELATAARSTSPSADARRFVLRLHNGIVTAEEFIGPGRPVSGLVARTGGPTFLRATGARCWRRLAGSDPRTLLNVGAPFPENGKLLIRSKDARARQLVIETHSGFWFLASHVTPGTLVRKSFLTLTIAPATYAIRSLRVRVPDPAVRAELKVTPVTTAPSIPSPTPAC